MTEQEETSLEYFYKKVLEIVPFFEHEYKGISDALNKAKEMYEDELTKAYIRGSDDAEGYN